ncbi:hypothetical protein F4782DRAFT_64772 [Xylaria castorea]|nr:hypothetical protein F4782DRAFT_64772 [Xylaria castorea]
MAYHTTIFEDARKDYSIGGTRLTYGSTIGDRGRTPYSSISMDPFYAFGDGSVPTPPPDSARFAISQDERDQKVADAVWAARQRELYATPGVGGMTAELRSWNGRRVVESPPSLIASIISIVVPVLAALVLVAVVLVAVISVVMSAVKVDISRIKTVGREQFTFWLGRGYYHILQCWRAVVIELRFIIARIKLVSLVVFSTWTLVIVMLKAAMMLGADPRPGKMEYVFVNECRSWSVVAYQGLVATLH